MSMDTATKISKIEILTNEDIDRRYFASSKIFYQCCFIWPYQNRKIQMIGRTFLLLNMFHVLYLSLSTAIYKSFKKPIDWAIAVQNIFECCFLITILSIFLIFTTMESKIKKFNTGTVDYWNSVTIPEEKKILIDSSLKHRKIIIFLRIFIMLSYVGFAIIPATMAPIANRINPSLNWTKQLCTTSELPRREQYFELWFIYTIFIMTMFGTIVCSLLAATTVFINVNLVRFYLIGHRLKKLHNLVSISSFSFGESSDHYIHNEVKDIAEQHNGAIEYFKTVQTFARKVLIIITSNILCGLSFTGTMVLYAWKNKHVFLLVEMSLSFTCIIFLSFLISHFGQLLNDISSDIFDECYSSGWYHFPLKTRPLIQVIMMRALKPCELTSGPSPLLNMNYENFNSLVNTAVSYMTVMASLM